MVIIKQDPVFSLNYVIVHCNFSCSVGATHRQELKQSANYKDRRSPYLLSLNYFFSFSWSFPSQLWHISAYLWFENLFNRLGRGGWRSAKRVQSCEQSRSRSPAPGSALHRQREGGQGLKGRIWPSILVLSHQDPSLHITPRKHSTTLCFPPSFFFFFLNLNLSWPLLHSV